MAHVVLTTDVKSFAKTQFQTNDELEGLERSITTTRPNDANSTVIGTSLNYMKIKLFSEDAVSKPFYVWGWSFWPDAMAWVPQLLCSFTGTMNATSSTLPDGTVVYEMATATKLTGDVKIYSGTGTTKSGAFVMVDTVGCQFLEITSYDLSQPVIHVFTSGL